MKTIGRFNITFDHTHDRHTGECTRLCAPHRFAVKIFPTAHPDFMAGSYYEATFLGIAQHCGLRMMGGELTSGEVDGIKAAIIEHLDQWTPEPAPKVAQFPGRTR